MAEGVRGGLLLLLLLGRGGAGIVVVGVGVVVMEKRGLSWLRLGLSGEGFGALVTITDQGT